jgi:type IV secretion system protein VirD4
LSDDAVTLGPGKQPFSLPPTKTLIRLAIAASPWALYVVWMAAGVVDGVFFTTMERLNNGASVLLIFNLWGLAAALGLAALVLPLTPLSNFWRSLLGCMAIAVMMGRFSAGYILGLMAGAGHVDALKAFCVAPFALFALGLVAVLSLSFVLATLTTIFVITPMLMFLAVASFDRSAARARYETRGIASRLTRGMDWIMSRTRERAPDDSKGARFATIREIRKLHQPDDARSMGFGAIGENTLMLKTEKHVLIMASTRSGKGVSLIIPHLLRYQGSVFCLDPKGENARASGRQRARLNRQVHYLDPFGISGKPQSRYNPLSRFTPDNMEAESKALAAAMFVVPERQRGDHFTTAGQQLLATFILYVYADPKIERKNKDLPTVRRALLGNAKQSLEAMKEMYDVADGLLVNLARSFLQTPEKEFGSVLSAAQRQTEILDNPYIAACLSATGSGPEVDFKAWHRDTMTVYLCLSAPKFPVFNRWLRLVLVSALDEMTDAIDAPQLPVCFMLDELATLGHLEPVENAIGLAAGYGIQLVTVFQDVAQMRDLYHGRWASIIGNSGVRALFNLDDFETAEYWSKTLGNRFFENRSHQEDIYGLNSGDNVSQRSAAMLSPDELMHIFASNKMLILAQGAHPIATDRKPYFDDPFFGTPPQTVWDDPRGPVRMRPRQTAGAAENMTWVEYGAPTARPVAQAAAPVAQPTVRSAAKLTLSDPPTESELRELNNSPEGSEFLAEWLKNRGASANTYDPSWFKPPR